MAERTTYYKAAAANLAAPYRAGHGQLYLPGTEHTPDWFDPDAAKSCTHGLYFCSHRRVAARWGPVVLQVQILGNKVKTNDKVRPGAQPDAVKAQKYQKYRTDRMRILGIVGVTGYAGDLTRRYSPGTPAPLARTEQSRTQALENAEILNEALRRAGLREVYFTGQILERLRDDSFNLWGVNDPNMVQPVQRYHELRVRHRVEIEFEAFKQLAEADISNHMGQLLGVYDGSQRIIQMR